MLTRIRLTLKQHRFETIAVVVLCLLAVTGALIEAFRLNAVQVPADCIMGGRISMNGGLTMGAGDNGAAYACELASRNFNGVAWSVDVGIVRTLLLLLPFIVGIAFGAPLVAKELEQGTAPLSWALSGSRRKWLLGKLLAAMLLIVPLLLVAGLAADVLQGALSRGVDPHASFEDFQGRGLMMVFWGVAALMGTMALGALTGRTLPAVLVALVVCGLARGLWEPAMNRVVLAGAAVRQDDWSIADLYIRSETYLDGKRWMGDPNTWYQEHQPVERLITPDASGNIVMDGEIMETKDGQPFIVWEPVGSQLEWVQFVIHGDQYWPVTALETLLLGGGAALFAGVGLVWVDRRRPY
jgi:hypothetical protein